MTSNFKIIDFKTLGKRDINGFLNEKADEVWYDGMYGNPDRSVRMVAKVYFPENFKETLINEGLKVLARKRVEYKNRKPSELYNNYKYGGALAAFDNVVQFEQPVKINHDVLSCINLYFNPLVKTGTRSLAVYSDEEFTKLVNERNFKFEYYRGGYFGFDSEKNRYYVSIIVNIDTHINSDPRFLNRSKSKAAWRKRVKEAYSNLINNGFDIPVWSDGELVFEQKI